MEHPLPSYEAGQQIGGYEVVEKVNEGMLGAVYKVNHVKTGQVVALKLIRPQLLPPGMDIDRFNHELSSARQVEGAGLVELLDSGAPDGVRFFTK